MLLTPSNKLVLLNCVLICLSQGSLESKANKFTQASLSKEGSLKGKCWVPGHFMATYEFRAETKSRRSLLSQEHIIPLLWLSLLSSVSPHFISFLPCFARDPVRYTLQLCVVTSAFLLSLLLSSNSSARIWLVYLLHGNATFVRQFPRPMDRVGPLEGTLRSTRHETQQILSSDFMILPCNYFFKLLWK